MIYEELKKLMSVMPGSSPSILVTLGMAAMSKTVATVATYPYQVVRARLQDHRQEDRLNVRQVISRVWNADRWRGFYRGLMPNVWRVLPGTCLTFVVYESVLHQLSLELRVEDLLGNDGAATETTDT
jgi:solute carrier family 25 folate transporter 32